MNLLILKKTAWYGHSSI